MIINEHDEHEVTIFTLEGRIDVDGELELEKAILAAVAEGRSKLVLDLENVEFISSSGLRILANALVITQRADGNLHIGAVSKKIHRVMEIIGFHHFFQLYEDTSSAVQAFR